MLNKKRYSIRRERMNLFLVRPYSAASQTNSSPYDRQLSYQKWLFTSSCNRGRNFLKSPFLPFPSPKKTFPSVFPPLSFTFDQKPFDPFLKQHQATETAAIAEPDPLCPFEGFRDHNFNSPVLLSYSSLGTTWKYPQMKAHKWSDERCFRDNIMKVTCN